MLINDNIKYNCQLKSNTACSIQHQDGRAREERALEGGEDVQGVPVHAQHDDHLRDAGLGVAAEDDD